MKTIKTLLTLILLQTTLFALDPVILKDGIGEYPLGKYLEILEDKTGKLNIDDVRKPEFKSQWIKSKWDVPNFSVSDSVYWLRLKLHSKMKKSKKWLLELSFPLVDYIDYFLLDKTKISKKVQTGDRRPFNTREQFYRNFVFEINIYILQDLIHHILLTDTLIPPKLK